MNWRKTMNSNEIELTEGFWHDIYERNASVSIYSVQKRFEESGRFEALRFTHNEKSDTPLHFFFDSDVAKWIEAVGYLLSADRERYAELEDFCDKLIDSIEKNQREDGYFNSYFQQLSPNEVFTNRDMHELYCMGHFIEAAVVYDRAIGKHKLLNIAERMAECIEKVFVNDDSAPYKTGGHEEIEIALLRLYDYTENKKYLSMAEHFINERGANKKDRQKELNPWVNEYYQQDNAAARDMQEADGHAVRACYYYTAMAELAYKTGDRELAAACKRLYENIVNKKMYITGGVGSSRMGESFVSEYILPNNTAYSESCAAIAMMLFCRNMLKLEHSSKYSDTIERIMYNGFLSSTSLDGKAFFYENPLEINLAERNTEKSVVWAYRQKYPVAERLEIFDCSCCPPNINRTTADIASYAYFKTDNRLYIEQFMSSKVKKYGLTIETKYPNEDTIKITGNGYPYDKISVRIPSWCDEYEFSREAQLENGYATFDVNTDFEITLTYKQKVRFIYSNTRVFSNIGKVAVTCGPVVYCLEGIDNGGTLSDIFIDTNAVTKREAPSLCGLCELVCEGIRFKNTDALYSDKKPEKIPQKLRLIPYFAFANRGKQNMQVWINELNF